MTWMRYRPLLGELENRARGYVVGKGPWRVITSAWELYCKRDDEAIPALIAWRLANGRNEHTGELR